MNYTFGTKNLSRVQKALQQLERLTPIQIQKIAGQESLAQLRLKGLKNHKQKFNNNSGIQSQGQSGNGSEHEKKQEGQGVRWNIFKQMPVLAYKQSERKYQKQFVNKIDEYRKNIFKNQEDKWGKMQKEANQQMYTAQQIDSKKNPQFSAVLANQTSSGSNIQKQTAQNKPLFNKPQNNIFPQNNQGVANTPAFGSVGTWPKTQQLKSQAPKPQNIGFVPNLTASSSSDLFTKKFQVPEIMPPQKLDSKSNLFPQSNPLSHVKATVPYNIFTSKPADLFTKNNDNANTPKINIYEKKFNVEQPEPVKALQVGKGGLFTKNNPISEIDSSKVSNNMFTNNTTNTNLFKNKEQIKPNPPKQSVQPEKPTFQPPTQTPNMFTNSTFNNNSQSRNTGRLTANLSGPLFSNKIASNTSGHPTSNIFENKKFDAVQQKNTNIFKNTSMTQNALNKPPLFSNPTNDKPNPFSFLVNAKKMDQPVQKMTETPTILRQQTEQNIIRYQPPAEQKGSFFNLKPVEVETSKQPAQTPKQDVKAPPKKVNQIFKQFANKSNATNMFSNKQANTSSPFGKPPESSIFGGLGKSSGGIFGGEPSSNNTQGIFGKKDQVPMFGAKKEDEDEQEEDEGQDNDVIQDKEEADPTKSTGNYKYEQSEVIYRQTIPKFKRTTNPIIENVIISIEKFSGNKNFTLSVRLSNKCINYSGTIVPGVTQASQIKQNQYKNISVKKIMSVGADNKPNLQLLKIQFRDEKQGRTFFDKISIAIRK